MNHVATEELAGIDRELARGDTSGAPPTVASLDALLDAVYAELDDDAPRMVLADYLQQCGNPRGELIGLQLARAAEPSTPAQESRESELIENHARDWLGAIAPVVLKKVDEHERAAGDHPIRSTPLPR